ncbi:hypothetical protein FGG08_002740 [Glutinoglossum americanum]|uniref:Ankyrin repeat protein n=1 Tax=Glutinoglossum americanum TaxID=1670608 RepID=A0A9P8I912_9PEZI|nr:hypothetical protein FGG08_002740 [Glutinoglossum americanum]
MVGASPGEQVLEACRRNNTELLQEVIDGFSDKTSGKSSKKYSYEEQVADLLNNAVDGIGNNCLHLAAAYGSYEVMDMLLDQEGLEVDPLDRMEKDTPLHKAVRFVNGLPKAQWENGKLFVELLLDAGADPRVRNKAKLKPVELVDPRNSELRKALQKGEYSMTVGASELANNDDDDGAHNSASDSE